jgi:hypothetical protein
LAVRLIFFFGYYRLNCFFPNSVIRGFFGVWEGIRFLVALECPNSRGLNAFALLTPGVGTSVEILRCAQDDRIKSTEGETRNSDPHPGREDYARPPSVRESLFGSKKGARLLAGPWFSLLRDCFSGRSARGLRARFRLCWLRLLLRDPSRRRGSRSFLLLHGGCHRALLLARWPR